MSLSRNPGIELGHVQRRSTLDTRNKARSSVARGSFVTCDDRDDASGASDVFAERDAVLATLKGEPNDAPQNTLLSRSACSAGRYQENDRLACTCSIKNHRNHCPTRESEARRSHSAPRVSPITKRYFARIFPYCHERTYGLSMENWMEKRDCLWGSRWRTVLILCLFVTACNADSQCAVGLNTPGWTWPHGDIILQHGQPLKILCILNQTYIDEFYPGKNVSDLVFFHNKKEMEPEFITIVNKTTISMDVQLPPPADDVYYCKLRLDKYKSNEDNEDVAVCLNKVVIGFPPQEPKNFKCVSFNWERLFCSWEPVPNYVPTKYTIMFILSGRANRRKSYYCPLISPPEIGPNQCLWDSTTNPIYRQPYPQYLFILIGSNVFANVSFQYKFDHYSNVIPAKPVNLSVINKTSDSVTLRWTVPHPLENFPVGLHYRIMYQNHWDHQKPWQVINITTNEKNLSIRAHSVPKKIDYDLTDLPYANTGYDVRVFIKSATSVGEEMWSKFSNVTFRTLPKLPGLPPRTDIGSFEITESNANRDVYLYWQAIPQNQENGDNFKYQITHVEENGRQIDLGPPEITKTFAKFKGLSFNNYRFEIATVNAIGANKDRAKIFVPSQTAMPNEPIAFTKIAFDKGLYELSWKPPMPNERNNEEITNYTIFWCDNDRDRPYQCTGYLDWVHVSKDTTIYNMTVPEPAKVYQFAIAANTNRGSSGMVWASCTVIHNKVVGKMKSVWINRIGSHFIEVGWKLDCSDRIGIVEGFNIYYCPIVSPYNVNCKGPKLNSTIKADPRTIHGIIENLKPYTTYMLSVAVLTKNGEGLHSDPLLNTTLEAAPSTPPQNVKIINVTNTTMFITWEPPEAMNGVLRYYEVYYNGLAKKVEEGNHVELQNLLAYKTYNVSVAACTVSCSKKSSVIHQVTQIGVPGKINVPTVRFINSSQVIVKWDKPQETAGPLGYYEIITNDGDIYNSTKTEVQLPIFDCKTAGQERRYQFRVRAVNIAVNNKHLKGSWSDAGEGNCYSDGPSARVWIVIWTIGGISVIMVLLCFAYAFKRMWLKCRAMQDVEVKLPPGLASNMKLLQKVGEQHIRQPSADSSGCSSAQESVTSSLTADSQVSSDSGTEVDPAPVSPDKLLETLPTWESNSLRQRNVGVMRPSLGAETAHWDTYVKVNKSGEPLIGETASLARSTPNLTDNTGYTTSQHTWSSTGYISMPSSEELSSNPSPVPRENSNVAGPVGYSIVGILPKSVRIKSEDGDGTIDIAGDTLIRPKKTTIPYVTIPALEQKMREQKQQQPVSMLRDLDELTFEPSVQKVNNTLASHFNIDPSKMSQQCVQTGFVDAMQKPFALNPIDFAKSNSTRGPFVTQPLTGHSTCNRPYVSSFATSSTSSLTTSNSLAEPSSSKSYVSVSSIPELTKPLDRATTADKEKPYVRRTDALSENSSKPYVLLTSVHGTQQQQPEEKEEEEEAQLVADLIKNYKDDDNDNSDEEDATYLALSWQEITADEEMSVKTPDNPDNKTTLQNIGYVTIASKPGNPEQQQQQQQQTSIVTATIPTSHERLEKTSSSPQTTVVSHTSSDELYSKVAAVPSTIQ